MKVPFFRLSFGKEEKREVLDVLRSGWVTSGLKVQKLESRIINLTGAKYAAAVSSATAGLHLVLKSLDIGAGDEVITSPYTMAATVEAILYTGARPVLADIDPVSLNIDPGAVEKKITKKTKAILPVDIAGCPCDYRPLKRLGRKYNIPLVADAAHSLGGKYEGRMVGALADAAVFSFYSTKNITTGEGGMVVTDKKRLIDRVRHLSLHGMTSSGWKRYQGGSWRYDITDLGYKYNLSDLAAALGVGQLARFNEMQDRRIQLVRRYLDSLRDLHDYIELPFYSNIDDHAWHLFIIRINRDKWKIGRDRLITELEKAGVGCGVHFIPIYKLSYFRRKLKYDASDFPHCESAFLRVISLPFYVDLKISEVDYVCRTLKNLRIKFGR
ncbi:MAG: DegT/DnrJ/EryC1/StrS aminotransferase family protein [Candidatus Zixiibacteriota bacterium]